MNQPHYNYVVLYTFRTFDGGPVEREDVRGFRALREAEVFLDMCRVDPQCLRAELDRRSNPKYAWPDGWA